MGLSRKVPFVLLHLPEHLSRFVISQWLKLKDMARIDSAFCGGGGRVQYRTLAYGRLTTLPVVLNINNKNLESILRWAIPRNAQMDSLNISGRFTRVKPALREFLILSGRAVKCICIRSLPVDDAAQDAFLEIASWCPNVTVVDIRYGSAYWLLSWDYCLSAFARQFQNLTHLTLCGIKNSSEGLASALRHCKRLENVEIRTGFASIPVEVAIPTLKYITLYAPNLTDGVLTAIGQECHKLETLDVFATSEMEGYGVTDVGVRAVLQGCPLLRQTDVQNAGDISIELRAELARRCNLTKLYFRDWWGGNDELARELLKVSPNLTVLDCAGCVWLTDATLAVCAQCCPRLETVVLDHCPMVTGEGVRALLVTHGAKLRKIGLAGCHPLGDDTLLAIAEHCPLLERVVCPPDTTDAAVATLAQGCP
jgi:hypothetical protein